MVLAKKSMAELEKFISEMSPEQFRALKSDIDEKLYPEMTIEELTAARDKLNMLIDSAQEAEREKFVLQAKEWAERAKQLGLDLGAALGVTPPVRVNRYANGSSGNGEKASPKPKYRDPVTGQTWSGRGLQPKFITLAIEQGRIKSKDEFLIKE